MKDKMKVGFTYLIEEIKDGQVVSVEEVKNLVPAEGITHILNTVLKGGAQTASWFIGLYEGNYTPVGTDTAATFPGSATECTTYSAATRVAFTPGAIAAGSLDNAANKAEFTLSANKVVYGGFISSASAKGSTSGILLSAVRFGSPKSLDSGSVLRVTAGFTLVSA